jgi:hypothetical protein
MSAAEASAYRAKVRAMLGRRHPAIDALEARIAAPVTVTRSGRFYVAEAGGVGVIGSGRDIPQAVRNLTRNMGLTPD